MGSAESSELDHSSTDAFYNEYANARVPHPRAVPVLRWWHRQLLHAYERESGRSLRDLDFLEVGVGHGYCALEAQAMGARYRALEMSRALVDRANAAGLDAECGRLPPLPPHLEGKADVVWMSHVLEHARDWVEARQMAEAALHALRRGGHFVVIAPDCMDWGVEFWNVDWSHGFPTTAKRCIELLSDAGFVNLQRRWHRGGRFDAVGRTVSAALARVAPYKLVNAFARRPGTEGGFGYSYMAIFGWRQLFVMGTRP
jgi:SAM-dependent methyltransferase